MNERMTMALVFPLLAVLTIIGFGGGLGITFMLLKASVLGEWGVIILGLILVAGVPTVAALLQRRVEKD